MSLKNAEVKETNRVELEIEVGAEEFEAAVAKAYKKNIGKMNIPGFRKGKALVTSWRRCTVRACSMRML